MSLKRVVVVGGCGFIGSHVTALLLERGCSVTSVHRSPGAHWGNDAECRSVDYRDESAMNDVLQGACVLIHLGSQSVPRTSVDLGVIGILDEVHANARLFEVAARRDVPTVVYASSGGSVYGECKPGTPITEQHKLSPVTPHGLLKAMTEQTLNHITHRTQQRGVSLRPGNVYGPGQRREQLFGVVPHFISNLKAGQPIEIWGEHVVRDYVFVEDAALAFVQAAMASGPLPAEINVGTGSGNTAMDVYHHLSRTLEITVPVHTTDRPESDPLWNVLSIDLLRDSLGCVPEVSLALGLERTVAAGEINPILRLQITTLRRDERPS